MRRARAIVEQRVFVEGPDREIIPDIHVRQPQPAPPLPAPSTAAVADVPIVLEVAPVEVRESYIQVLDRYAGMKVVTVIEVVSPSNKRSRKGRRPSFDQAAPPATANQVYEAFVADLRRLGVARVETGVFQADMQVHLINDGPVTILCET